MAGLDLPQLLIPKEVSALLRVSEGTLAQWRHHKRYALPFVKIGRAVRYRPEDVAAFMEKGAAR
jgi:excisionase family DNA binding protein